MSEPRGILIICLSKGFGGAEIRVLTMAKGLHGHRPYVVATLTDSPLAVRLADQGLRGVGVGRSRTDPRLIVRLMRLIRAHEVAVVDSHNPQSYFWGTAACVFARVQRPVCTIHQVFAKATGGWWKPWLYTATVRLGRICGANYIAVSGEVVDWLRGLNTQPSRVHFSANGLTKDWAGERRPAGLREALGWQTAVMIGIIGRLVPEKAHPLLFEALAGMRGDHPNLRCLVVGVGPEQAKLAAIVARLHLEDIVHFAGYREDVADILDECDLLCLPSLSEGFPYIAIEAAWLACPAVLSVVGDIPAFFEDGKTARLVDPGDMDGLIAALSWMAANPDAARALGQAAQEMAHSRLSAERMIEETLRVYDG